MMLRIVVRLRSCIQNFVNLSNSPVSMRPSFMWLYILEFGDILVTY